MSRMRWVLLGVLLALIGLAHMRNVRADVGASFTENLPSSGAGTFETTVVTSSTSSVGTFNPNDLLYGFKVWASSAGGVAGLYDTASVQTAAVTQGIFIDEGGEATQYDVWQSSWPSPYKLVTDLTVVLSGATVVIYHDVK